MSRILVLFSLFIICLTNPTSLIAREVRLFNGDWQFYKGNIDSIKKTWENNPNIKWENISLPHTWNAEDMQTKYKDFYEGDAYYRKKLFLSKDLCGKELFLKFEGVGSTAEVYVNGKLSGTHFGGYSAFVVDITRDIVYGQENNIVVKVSNKARPDVIPINHVLFGVYGGIYRPVWLITKEKVGITMKDNASSGVYISQTNHNKKSVDVEVKVKLENNDLYPVPVILENTIYTMDGKKVKNGTDRQEIMLTPQGIQSYVSKFKIRKPHLWNGLKDPYLYKVVSTVYLSKEAGSKEVGSKVAHSKETQNVDNNILDVVEQPLGIRKYEIIPGKGFYLNGEKYPMYGVCRHQDWYGLGSALENKHHDADLNTIMDLGATTVRFAHYQQSEYLYSRCDSLGLIIWAEIPFVNRVSGQEAANAHMQLRELIRQNYNHPSIYVWGLHNEVYRPHSYTSSLTASLHDLAKTEDPYRYTVSVSGYGHMEHPVNLNADIQAMNRYFGWYEKSIKDIVPWIKGLEEKYPNNAFILSEYGADANIEHQTEYLGESLNWTKPYYPETFQTKTHEYHWSVIANHPYIIASYLWNTFDFATPMANRGGVPARNMKGLVTFDRKTKKDSYYWYKANWSNKPVMHITQRRNNIREKRHTTITVYSNVGVPEVYLNGKRLSGIKKGFTDVHYIIENVTLLDGKNVVEAFSPNYSSIEKELQKENNIANEKNYQLEGKIKLSEYRDKIVWYYNGEKNRGPENYINEKVHSGL